MTNSNSGDPSPPVPAAGDVAASAFVQVRKRPKKTTWPWLLAGMVFIAIVSVIIGAVREGGNTGSLAGDLGYAFGASIIPALLLGFAVYGVLYVAVLKRSNRDNGGKYLAILIITALLSGTGMAAIGAVAGHGGVDGQMLRDAMDVAHLEQEAERTRIEGEIAKADPDLFKAASLKRRGGYARAHAELNRRRGLIDEAAASSAAIGARLRRAAESAIENPVRRERMVAEFDAGYRGRELEVAAFWDSQRRLLDLTEEHLELLQRTNWTAQGENYVFYRQSDLAAFDARRAEIARLTVESEREAERLQAGLEAGRREVNAELNRLWPADSPAAE